MEKRIAVVTGSSGLIGSAVVPALESAGYSVRRLVRHTPSGPLEHEWNPAAGAVNLRAFDGAAVVINLSGENIGRRWTAARLARIRASRLATTGLIARVMGDSATPPAVVVNASAVGYYGDRGDELLDERSSAGTGPLAELTRDWEEATMPLRDRGVRVVLARSGVVLTTHGGALRRLLLPFRLGVGGRLGDGRQWMSWITLEDEVRAILHAIEDGGLAGPVNFTAPEPVTNAELTRLVSGALGRPAVLHVPSIALRLIFGEMASETLLASQRAVPTRLTDAGFTFRSPTMSAALQRMLGPRS